MQNEQEVYRICENWLKSTHVPDFLKVTTADGLVTMYEFRQVVSYVLHNLGGRFSYDTLNRALQQLIKSGRIPAHKGQKRDANGLWHDVSDPAKADAKRHQQELAHMGVVKDNRSHAEEEKQESTNTLGETLKRVIGQINKTQDYVPKSGAQEVIRHIPDERTQEQLKQYSPAEIRAYLKRQRDKQQLEQSPY